MKVNAIKCPKCGDTIYSRSRHDMHWCSCQNVAIDGGSDYVKLSFKEGPAPEIFKIDVDATPKELYDDWNNGKHKYGTIKEKRSKK